MTDGEHRTHRLALVVIRVMRRGAGVVLGGVGVGLVAAACAGSPEARRPIDEADARHALGEIAALAAQRTPAAMASLCELSLDECRGSSGTIVTADDGPRTAPGPDRPPQVLCSIDGRDGSWMLVVAGDDGLGRPYVSQIVFARDEDDRTVPLREPAFWYGVSYATAKVTGSVTWSTAYSGSAPTAHEHTEAMLARARRACPDE